MLVRVFVLVKTFSDSGFFTNTRVLIDTRVVCGGVRCCGFVGGGGVNNICDSFVGSFVFSFVLGMCAYRSAFVSSCSCNWMEVQQQRSNSSHGGGSMTTFVAPICNCGEFAVLRTTTIKNGGRQFWGCPKYNVRCIELWFMKKNAFVLIFWLSFCLIQSRSGVSMRCNFFRWCIEDTRMTKMELLLDKETRFVAWKNVWRC